MALWKKAMNVALVAMLLGAACGEAQKTGSAALLDDISDKDGGNRLGEETIPPVTTKAPISVAIQDTPKPTFTPQPTLAPTYYDIKLIADSPYYEVEGKPVNQLAMRLSAIIRVTNADTTPERGCRSFTEKDEQFHSGCLKAGQSWQYKFPNKAHFAIKDQGLPFANATLDVV